MFARMSTIQGKPERVDEGIREYRQQTLAELKKQSGFKGAYLLADRTGGKMIGITLWETEKHLKDSNTVANKLRAQGAQTADASKAPAVEVYEVVVQP